MRHICPSAAQGKLTSEAQYFLIPRNQSSVYCVDINMANLSTPIAGRPRPLKDSLGVNHRLGRRMTDSEMPLPS